MKYLLSVLQKLKNRISRIWFSFAYKPLFLSFGQRSFFHNSFRLEGIENIAVGDSSIFQSGCWLYCVPIDGIKGSLSIGSHCVLGYNNHITSVRDVVIEDFVLTANNVYISDNLHAYNDIDVPIILQPVKFKASVRIGRGSWLGENVSIIGASIGRNCVIGANSVVTKDIPDFSVAVGIPAVVIKHFDVEQQLWVAN